MPIFNPFSFLMETKKYPHAHSHRTTFGGKLKDSFQIFYGGRTHNREDQLGIFDFLTLGLHYAVNKLIFAIGKNINPIACVVLYGIWNLPRILFAGLGTLIFSPVTYLAHTVLSKEGNLLREGVLSYKLDNPDYLIHMHDSVLPDTRDKNTFIFLCRKNQLYWVDNNGATQRTDIHDLNGFRAALDIDRVRVRVIIFATAKFHNKEQLNQFLTNPPVLQPGTFKEFLEARELDLEDIQASSIQFNEQNDQEFDLSLGRKIRDSITEKEKMVLWQRIPVKLSNAEDVNFFSQLRKLNVGRIQSAIEEDDALQAKFN